MTYESFMKDIKTQDAVVRNLEIIGEAVKNVSETTKATFPSISWSDLAKVRDKLIHHYFGVNFDIVWGILTETLPDLSKQIQDIVDD